MVAIAPLNSANLYDEQVPPRETGRTTAGDAMAQVAVVEKQIKNEVN